MKHLDDLVQQIKERREILKITQESLADLSGVGLRTIKQLEGGKGNPTSIPYKKLPMYLEWNWFYKLKN